MTAQTELAPPRVNVLDPEFYVDPWAAYRWLRDEAPVFWDPAQRLWVVRDSPLQRTEPIFGIEEGNTHL